MIAQEMLPRHMARLRSLSMILAISCMCVIVGGEIGPEVDKTLIPGRIAEMANQKLTPRALDIFPNASVDSQ